MKSTRSLVAILMVLSFCMFGFTFALIPLYNVFCQVTGLNGKMDTQSPNQFTRYKITDPNIALRRITVEFDTNRNKELPCEFSPAQAVLQVIPGELTHTSFRIKNLTTKEMVIQAIPSITPGFVAKHLKKLECFCFDQQTLKPNETVDFPLRFWLEPEIPTNIHRLTLSYTLFDVTDTVRRTKRE